MRAAGAFLALVLVVSNVAAALAQQQEHDPTALAKATQNPVGDLTALPFQFNFNTGGDMEDQTFFNLNFQPVIPFKVGSDWAVIARPIIPIDSIPAADGTRFSGIGDIQAEIFISPARPGKIIWGAGPMFSFPTATATPVRTGTWAGGVGGVALVMAGPWVAGALVNQFWPMSDAGGDPRTNLLVMQPFVNFNFARGYAIAFAPVMSANWDAPAGEEWTIPLGLGISRTTVFGGRPMTLGVHYFYNVERPTGASAQQLRFVVSLLYPRQPGG